MGILEDILSDKGSELTGALVDKAGFSPGEAQGFLPPAVTGVLEAVKGGGVDLGSVLGGGGAASLLSKLDLGALASSTGVDPAKAQSGLQSLIPLVLSALKDKAGGVDGILSALGGEGAGGALGKLAGKLFKR